MSRLRTTWMFTNSDHSARLHFATATVAGKVIEARGKSRDEAVEDLVEQLCDVIERQDR